jgi:hypothetical protein
MRKPEQALDGPEGAGTLSYPRRGAGPVPLAARSGGWPLSNRGGDQCKRLLVGRQSAFGTDASFVQMSNYLNEAGEGLY